MPRKHRPSRLEGVKASVAQTVTDSKRSRGEFLLQAGLSVFEKFKQIHASSNK